MKRKNTGDVIRLGLYIKSQKDTLDHGAFLPWVERELGISPSTAQRYMRTAKMAIRVVDEERYERG